MLLPTIVALAWAICSSPTAILAAKHESILVYKPRNIPGMGERDRARDVSRALRDAAVVRRDTTLKNSTRIEKAWDNAILFQLAM